MQKKKKKTNTENNSLTKKKMPIFSALRDQKCACYNYAAGAEPGESEVAEIEHPARHQPRNKDKSILNGTNPRTCFGIRFTMQSDFGVTYIVDADESFKRSVS